ncbi:hypothetical protein Y710_04690 [Gordonia sp. QH-12]|nr:hypothetical protein Y710_04690 [Gordonia sp. QH-12]
MSDSDKDTSAAIDKVVGAFRAQREQGKADTKETDTKETDAQMTAEPTPVKKLEDAPAPQGGGNSETPTKAFKIPAQAAPQGATPQAEGALVEETVVGDALSAGDAATGDAVDAGTDAKVDLVKADLVEQSIDLPADDQSATPTATDDEAPSDTDAASAPTVEVAAPADQPVEVPASEAPTTEMAVPAAVAAGAAAAGAAAPAGRPAQAKPAPQVVAPAETQRKRSRGKLIGLLVAAVIVIAAIAVGLWYALVGSSPEHKVADAAKDYRSAMTSGDLGKLREVTCGADYAYYSKVSDADFQKAFEAQKNRNELMTFDDVKAVQINGDTARVGVDMYPSNDPSKTAPAQITLHQIDGEWKVCLKP